MAAITQVRILVTALFFFVPTKAAIMLDYLKMVNLIFYCVEKKIGFPVNIAANKKIIFLQAGLAIVKLMVLEIESFE